MTDRDSPKGAPTPRDYDDATFSELVPIRSTQINLIKSPVLWVIGLSGVVVLALYSSLFSFLDKPTVDTFMTFGLIVIGWLLVSLLLVIYLYSRTDRPVWHFLPPAIFICAMLMTPLGVPYFIIFRSILPGNYLLQGNPQDISIPAHFLGNFFAAGLMEELMKTTTVIIGALLMVKYARLRPSSPIAFDAIAIRNPLDGLLMATVGGAAFIFIETGFQYFPKQFGQNPTAEGLLSGLMLLLPRTISGMVGHMGWAGITGYFVGLVVLRPSAWRYAIYAWIGTALIHAAWNTSSYIPVLGYLATAVTAVVYVACLLKARQINAKLGATRNDYGSIVIMPGDRPTSQLMPMSATTPPVKPPSSNEPKAYLFIAGERIAVYPGKSLDLSPLSGKGIDLNGLSLEVTTHPTRIDVIGLKNTGTLIWKVTLRDGGQIKLEPGRNIRIAPGVQIDFGIGPVASVEGT